MPGHGRHRHAGHVAGSWINHLTPPFYPKQLGVAFFLFAAGVLLAREHRRPGLVLFRRLFEVYLFGVGCAMLVERGITYARSADLAESNYLPFLLGVNVVLDAFPANPTTWYIGTYIHVLLLWALALRHLRVRPWMIALTALAEIAIAGRPHGAGSGCSAPTCSCRTGRPCSCWGSTRAAGGRAGGAGRSRGAIVAAILLALLILAWPPMARSLLDPVRDFPFMRFAAWPGVAGLVATSAAVTALYVSYTWATVRVAERVPAPAPVRFLARNTLFVFIAHMPVFYAIQGPVSRWFPDPNAANLVRLLICFPVLALVSEAIRRLVRPDRLRDRIWPGRTIPPIARDAVDARPPLSTAVDSAAR